MNAHSKPPGFIRRALQKLLFSLLDIDTDKIIREKEAIANELKEQLALLYSIAEHIPVAMFAKDVKKDYRYILWNRKAEELFGYSKERMIGKTDYDYFPEKEASFFRATDIKVMSSGKVVDIAHEDVTTARGTWSAHTIKVPIMDASNRPSIVLVIIEDVSERTKLLEMTAARAYAEHANRVKGQFLANMSHEIRTPMNGIIGMVEVLLAANPDAEQQRKLNMIMQSAELLLGIINDILDISKIEDGKLELEHTEFNMMTVVEDICALLQVKAREKALPLRWHYTPGVPQQVIGDPGRVRQVLSNLIGNAIKFTEAGQVSISVQNATGITVPSGKVRLSIVVEDTGIGISKKAQEHVFEKFRQADHSTTRQYGGSGLGLAICKELVEMMGGTIALASEQGKGTTVTFTLLLDSHTAAGARHEMAHIGMVKSFAGKAAVGQ